MRVLQKGADELSRLLAVLYGAGVFLLFLMICVAVFLRYLAGSSIYGLSEITNYLFVYLTALGAANAIRFDEHVGVDFFTRAPVAVRNVLRIFRLLVMTVVQGFLFYLSFQWIAKVGGYLTPLLRFPQRWAQVAIPIGMGLGIVMCVACMLLGYDHLEKKEIHCK